MPPVCLTGEDPVANMQCGWQLALAYGPPSRQLLDPFAADCLLASACLFVAALALALWAWRWRRYWILRPR